MSGTTIQKFTENYLRPEAEAQAISEVVVEALLKKENPEVTDEMMEKQFEKIAAAYRMPVETIKERFANQIEGIKHDLQVDIILDKMVANATFHAPAKDDEEDSESATDNQPENA